MLYSVNSTVTVLCYTAEPHIRVQAVCIVLLLKSSHYSAPSASQSLNLGVKQAYRTIQYSTEILRFLQRMKDKHRFVSISEFMCTINANISFQAPHVDKQSLQLV